MNSDDTSGIPEEVEEELSERTFADYDDDGQLKVSDRDEEYAE
jgi:hypothetical protein